MARWPCQPGSLLELRLPGATSVPFQPTVEQTHGPDTKFMKILRLVLLAVAIAAAALAAYLFARLSLEGAFPPWLLARVPSLILYERWLPQDLLTLAYAAAIVACLCFGLAVPAWEGLGRRRMRAAVGTSPMTSRAFYLILLLVFALAGLLWLWPTLGMPEGWLQSGMWLAGIAIVAATGVVLQRERSVQIWGDDAGRPERSWPLLAPILLLAGFLGLWQGNRLPAMIPPETIAVGLQAQSQGSMLGSGVLAGGEAGLPWLATLSTALSLAFARNPFEGLLWAGSAAALALVVATWLLGCELFRRAPVVEGLDDGRMAALLGALATSTLLPALHLARLPTFLAPALWGALGLWALLRAARTGNFVTVAAAGILTGMALLLRPSGAVLAAVALVTWSSVALMRRRLLAREGGGVGWRGFWLWGAAAAITAAPGICFGECGVTHSLAQSLGSLNIARQGLTTILATLGIVLPSSPDNAPMLIFFGPLLGALFLLALGGLLFHVDQPIGLILLGWLVVGIAAAAPQSQQEIAYGALAVLLPAVGLSLAFALDRATAALVRSLGAWAKAAATLLSVGILLLAALINVRDYPARMGTHPDATMAAARVIARLSESGSPIVLFADDPNAVTSSAVVRFARGKAQDATLLPAIPVANPAAWPATLPAGARLLLPPEPGRQTLLLAQQRYPGGDLRVERDAHANPALFVYTLPGE